MTTKTKAKTAWDEPRFTIADIPPHPDHRGECVHQRPRHLATRDGWPRCADCRALVKARFGEYTPREPTVDPTTPDPWQEELTLTAADRAAGAHLEDR